MSDINFYHLQRSSLETVLPKLLEKTMGAGKRALVMASSTQKSEQLSNHLWTYEASSWMPNGSNKDNRPKEISPLDFPIWISDDLKAANDNINNAEFLFLTDNAQTTDLEDFQRVFVLFDGNNDFSLSQARDFWKDCKENNHDLTYWQQNERGGWDEKDSTKKH